MMVVNCSRVILRSLTNHGPGPRTRRTHKGRSFSDCVTRNLIPNPDTTGTCRSFSDCVTRNLTPNPDTTGTCGSFSDCVARNLAPNPDSTGTCASLDERGNEEREASKENPGS